METEEKKDMSQDFADVDKKNKNKDYIIILILYLVVIVLSIFFVLGLIDQKNKIIENAGNKNTNINEESNADNSNQDTNVNEDSVQTPPDDVEDMISDDNFGSESEDMTPDDNFGSEGEDMTSGDDSNSDVGDSSIPNIDSGLLDFLR